MDNEATSRVSNTILLTINGIHFLLESNKALTEDMKYTMEILCDTAYDEASDFVTALGKDKTLSDLYEISDFEVALIAQKVFRDKLGITVTFKVIDFESSINAI